MGLGTRGKKKNGLGHSKTTPLIAIKLPLTFSLSLSFSFCVVQEINASFSGDFLFLYKHKDALRWPCPSLVQLRIHPDFGYFFFLLLLLLLCLPKRVRLPLPCSFLSAWILDVPLFLFDAEKQLRKDKRGKSD